MIHFVSMDMHNTTTRAPKMDECYKYLCKKYGTNYAETLLIENPKKIIKKILIGKEEKNGTESN